MKLPTDGEIIPGKSIGQFELGASWSKLKQSLDGIEYKTEKLPNGFKVLTDSLWFFFDAQERLEQITALNKFSGKLRKIIIIGSKIGKLTPALGGWIVDEDGNFIVPSVPGICFNPHHSIDPDSPTQDPDTTIEFISVYND